MDGVDFDDATVDRVSKQMSREQRLRAWMDLHSLVVPTEHNWHRIVQELTTVSNDFDFKDLLKQCGESQLKVLA